MGVTIRQAAPGFGLSHQTIRNWIKNPLLSEFFSPNARRVGGHEQAELFADDLEVCNSIYVLIRQHLDWQQVAEKLATGWRDKDLPPRLMLALPPGAVESTAYALIARASAEQKSDDLLTVLRERDTRIAYLEAKLEQSDAEHRKDRESLLAELAKEREERAGTEARLSIELELYRSGRLKPLEG